MRQTTILGRQDTCDVNANHLLEQERTDYTRSNFSTLNDVLGRCKKIIEAEEGIRSDISFKEITKIILVKVFEEKRGANGHENRFSSGFLEKNRPGLAAFQRLFEDAKKAYPIYDETGEKLRISLRHEDNLLRIVHLLEPWSFSGVDEDVKGMLYEVFLKASLRGDLGQYFTPKEIVLFMIGMVHPDPSKRILDPACGSGGFLIHSLLKVKNNLLNEGGGPVSGHGKAIEGFLRDSLWGFEIDGDLHLLAKINLIMHGDGFSNIQNEDFLSYEPRKLCEKFEIVLTNPPFSFPVENQTVLREYELGRGKSSEQIDILYVEKCLRLLDEDGILAIVLPEGLLNLPSFQYFREFVLSKAQVVSSISLPAGTFIPFGQSNSKTCILVLQKRGRTEVSRVFVADAKEVGFEVGKKNYLRHGKNDLVDFLSHFESDRREMRTTKCGGRSMFVDSKLLEPERLDSKYYFMKQYVRDLRESGVKVKRLSEIASVQQPLVMPSRTPDKVYYYLEVPDISEETGLIGDIRKVKGESINGSKVKFSTGDILFARIFPEKNRIAIVPGGIDEGICSNEIFVVRPRNPKEMDPYALLSGLKSKIVSNQVKDMIAGSSSSRPRLSRELLEDILVPILSPEDSKIVSETMRRILSDYWSSSQGFIMGYKEVKSRFGE